MKRADAEELLRCAKAVLAIADRNQKSFNELREVIARIEKPKASPRRGRRWT